MKKYKIAFDYSRNGSGWTRTSMTVTASSEAGAIMQIESKYPYVRNVKVMSVR